MILDKYFSYLLRRAAEWRHLINGPLEEWKKCADTGETDSDCACVYFVFRPPPSANMYIADWLIARTEVLVDSNIDIVF